MLAQKYLDGEYHIQKYHVQLNFTVRLHRKSHFMGFRLIPISVTLNDLERRNSPYVALFHRIR